MSGKENSEKESLKEKILARSKKEGTPFEEKMLMNQLMKTLYSGIRNTMLDQKFVKIVEVFGYVSS